MSKCGNLRLSEPCRIVFELYNPLDKFDSLFRWQRSSCWQLLCMARHTVFDERKGEMPK